jgi:hypothetical protein
VPRETDDGGLPEPTSTIVDLDESKEHPPSYHGLHVEAGGYPIAELNQDQQGSNEAYRPQSASHELNAAAGPQRRNFPETRSHELNVDQQRYEASGNPIPRGQELSADQARYEASGDPVYTGYELPTNRPTPSPTPASPVSSPTRKPVPLATAAAGSSSFSPPWDSSGAAEYEKALNIGPAEAAVAEDQELQDLEEEVARVKMQKQRLQELQALEAKEEELRRSIAERKKMGAKKP